MKRLIVALTFVAVAGMCVYAATTQYLRGAGTSGSVILVQHDSTEVPVGGTKIDVDTFYSDTITIGQYTTIAVTQNLGVITKSDSSTFEFIPVITKAKVRAAGQLQWYTLRTDTMAGDTATAKDDSTKQWFAHLDSIPADYLYFETVIKDSVKSPTSTFTPATYLTKVPLWFTITGR